MVCDAATGTNGEYAGPIALCWHLNLQTTAYEVAWGWQHQWQADRISDPTLPDGFMLLEHPPVYTLGRGADRAFVRFDPATHPVPLVPIERGGEVTHHCPGQLVGYPILNLRRHQPDLHWYLRQLEEVLIRAIGTWGLAAERLPGLTGVWLKGCKVAAIGIQVSRWVTMHGFALNVDCELAGFREIVPCGIADRPVGRLVDFVPGLTVAQVRSVVAEQFAAVFGLRLEPCPPTHRPAGALILP
ncbi:MAG: lipoyl(octanoyl) transferase LipB [Limnothrix sp. CACIAM 69d]|nr:MAG: lipoyl(octanoyl) transferase LipB [Limnothrix sp. CACIAM 69d]